MACFDKKLLKTDCAGSDTVWGAAQLGGGGGAPQVWFSLADNVRYQEFIGQKYSNFSFVLSLSLSNESSKKNILAASCIKVTILPPMPLLMEPDNFLYTEVYLMKFIYRF
jgi:hypothetical protein